MTLHDLHAWVNTPPTKRDFETGRQLYEQFGKNRNLKHRFKRGANDWNTRKLAGELKDILQREKRKGNIPNQTGKNKGNGRSKASTQTDDTGREAGGNRQNDGRRSTQPSRSQKKENINADQTQTKQAPAQKQAAKGQPEDQPRSLENAPKEINDAFLSWKQVRNQADTLKQSLTDNITNAERKKRSEDVVDLYDLSYRLWDVIEHWKMTGQVLEIPKPKEEGKKPTEIDESDPFQVQKRITNLRTYISKAAKRKTAEEKVDAWQKELTHLEEVLANATATA